MRSVMSDAVAVHYNMDGLGRGGKLPFRTTLVMQAILGEFCSLFTRMLHVSLFYISLCSSNAVYVLI